MSEEETEGPFQRFGLHCKEGKFYICHDQRYQFLGCCNLDPCNDRHEGNCPVEQLRNSSYLYSEHHVIPPQRCQAHLPPTGDENAEMRLRGRRVVTHTPLVPLSTRQTKEDTDAGDKNEEADNEDTKEETAEETDEDRGGEAKEGDIADDEVNWYTCSFEVGLFEGQDPWMGCCTNNPCVDGTCFKANIRNAVLAGDSVDAAVFTQNLPSNNASRLGVGAVIGIVVGVVILVLSVVAAWWWRKRKGIQHEMLKQEEDRRSLMQSLHLRTDGQVFDGEDVNEKEPSYRDEYLRTTTQYSPSHDNNSSTKNTPTPEGFNTLKSPIKSPERNSNSPPGSGTYLPYDAPNPNRFSGSSIGGSTIGDRRMSGFSIAPARQCSGPIPTGTWSMSNPAVGGGAGAAPGMGSEAGVGMDLGIGDAGMGPGMGAGMGSGCPGGVGMTESPAPASGPMGLQTTSMSELAENVEVQGAARLPSEVPADEVSVAGNAGAGGRDARGHVLEQQHMEQGLVWEQRR